MSILLALLLLVPAAPTSAPATASVEQPLKPNLRFPTAASYEHEIGEPAVLLQNDHVWFFAPKRKVTEATIIFKRLTAAYDELHSITGLHTKYKMIVYHLPKGFGGTSECVIEYDYSNLDLDKSEEWKKHKVPHVSGYIEEMGHNFAAAGHVQFGWEMVGWSLGVKATQKVAPNPIFATSVSATRKEQMQTLARYRANNFVFPADLEANLCDRIHAALLYQCEQRYGPNFWRDFFTEMRREQPALEAASHLEGDDNRRNERYRIAVECFDRLRGLDFKKLLQQNHISATVDVKSLHPTDAGWDRKFEPPPR